VPGEASEDSTCEGYSSEGEHDVPQPLGVSEVSNLESHSAEEVLWAYGQRFGETLAEISVPAEEDEAELHGRESYDWVPGRRGGPLVRAALTRDLGPEAAISVASDGTKAAPAAPAAPAKEAAALPLNGRPASFAHLREEARLAVNQREAGTQQKASVPTGGSTSAGESQENELHLTFGYASSLGTHPPFARFDIRDSVCLRAGGFTHGQVVRDVGRKPVRELVVIGVKLCEGQPQLWFQPRYMKRPAAFAFPGASAALLKDTLVARGSTTQELQEVSLDEFDFVEETDGEVLHLCRHCRLPVGDVAYSNEDSGSEVAAVHGECAAQAMLRRWNTQEEARQQDATAQKRARRTAYGLGWTGDRIKSNSGLATTLGKSPVPDGMCCLVVDEVSLNLAATMEPAAAVRPEYLATALGVRLREGREPYFSLDPVLASPGEPPLPLASMEAKRFSPEWLAGTSVGEVLFQADYHLKELSMGECAQPIVGMRNCFDFSEDTGNDQWTAREWFVVKDAEVQVSEDNVLLARVRMGIEAREQIQTPSGVEDAPITRLDHPLVQYAEEFTHHFDLIAERKSVIFHLRELAKASILAKFIMESGMPLEDGWCHVAEKGAAAYCLDVPQLWNERRHSQIQVRDGTIVDEEKEGPEAKQHLVYGGVHFGLDRFELQPRAALTPAAQIMLASGAPAFGEPRRPAARGTMASLSMSLRRGSFMGTGPPPQQGEMTVPQWQAQPDPPQSVNPKFYSMMWKNQMNSPDAIFDPSARFMRFTGIEQRRSGFRPGKPGAPAGVDLSLDEFDLGDPQYVTGRAVAEAGPQAATAIGKAFWASLDGSGGDPDILKSEAAQVLKEVFNPYLSDRRNEGDQFVPPETSPSYVKQLRHLLKEEEVCKERRRRHFCSREFAVENPGPLFSSSWKASFEIGRARELRASSHQGAFLHERPDYKSEAVIFERILRTTTPEFHRTTEDGMQFRIYKFGSLEVRTTQERNSKEAIGVIFSVHAPRPSRPECGAKNTSAKHERIVKATGYVEGMPWSREGPGSAGQYHAYAVLETEQATTWVTEMLDGGAVSWEINRHALEVRNSVAKVFSAGDCHQAGISIKDLQCYQTEEAQRVKTAGQNAGAAARSRCYAEEVCQWARFGVAGLRIER
jgi:hypothetical protein